MTKFVSLGQAPKVGTNEKYVKQTNEAMSNVNTNLEMVALQIAQMPIREQNRFFRLLLNYIDITAEKGSMIYPPAGLMDTIMLCERMLDVVNDYYSENQLVLEGL